jgi:hypothetical protein
MLSYRFLPLLILSNIPFQMHVLSRDKFCTLIALRPKWSLAQYFDSSNAMTRKDYTRIKGVLDEAIHSYSQNGGTFDKNGKCIRPGTGKHGFKHVTEFRCMKLPAGSMKETFYALHHLKGFVRDAEIMNMTPRIREWSNKMAWDIDDANLREDFHRIQVKLSEIIIEDVRKREGSLHQLRGLCQRDIEECLDRKG